MDGEDLKQAQVVGGVSDLLHKVEQELGVRISINETERFGKEMHNAMYTHSAILHGISCSRSSTHTDLYYQPCPYIMQNLPLA